MDCGGAAWLPVRNSSISVRIVSGSVNQGAWSAPSTSRYRAPGMWSARYLLFCTGKVVAGMDDQRCAESVGRIARTSMRRFDSLSLGTCPGWRTCARTSRAGASPD